MNEITAHDKDRFGDKFIQGVANRSEIRLKDCGYWLTSL
jgi:hypothetical protein